MKFRHEVKHEISFFDSIELEKRLNPILPYDENGGPEGEYLVTSLYFDNYMDQALGEKLSGVNRREKFRLRYYGEGRSVIKLEKKQKVNSLVTKFSTELSRTECERLLAGDYEVLKEVGTELAFEFYTKLQTHMLRPKNVVSYLRKAYVYRAGNVRVTIDSNLKGTSNWESFLASSEALSERGAPEKAIILEVKYDEFLPQIIRDLVQLKNRKSGAFSKYAITRMR